MEIDALPLGSALLDATLVADEWRPVELRRGIYDDGTTDFEDGPPRRIFPGTGRRLRVRNVEESP